MRVTKDDIYLYLFVAIMGFLIGFYMKVSPYLPLDW